MEMSPQAAAAACGASRATGYRLWRRYQEGGWSALADRPPVPRRQPRRLSPELEQRILAAREYAKAGPLIVAGQLGLPASTVWKVLRRHGRSRLPRPLRGPVCRYERERPGELVHVDIKKLGRFWTVGKRDPRRPRSATAAAAPAGSTCTSRSTTTRRLAYAELLAERDAQPPAPPSSRRAVALVRRAAESPSSACSPTTATATAPSPGATPAPSSASNAATPGRDRPQTNGKAEALIKTLLREWAYRFAYPTSDHRARALPGYLRWYNQHRPHSSLGGRPPISRVSQVRGSHS